MKLSRSIAFSTIIGLFVALTLACGLTARDSSLAPDSEAAPEEQSPTQAIPPVEEPTEEMDAAPDSPFPLPADVQNFTKISDEQVNFQTSLNLTEVVEFYRREFGSQGLQERGILTVIEEATFSMVFDGSPNGKAIVVQGVKLDENTTNVNVRYEDV